MSAASRGLVRREAAIQDGMTCRKAWGERMIYKRLGFLFLFLVLAGSGFTVHAQGKLTVELNKLEERGDACRAYLVTENGTGTAFSAFTLDLVVFDHDDVIARRLAVDVSPLSVGKTRIRLFDLQGMSCRSLGRIVINDVLTCRDQSGPRDDCINFIEPRSRAGVPLVE